MFRPLRHALDQVVTTGYLTLIDAKGCAYAFGDLSGTPVVARIANAHTERRLFFNPALALGEAYMDGSLVMERGTIYDFLELLLANLDYGMSSTIMTSTAASTSSSSIATASIPVPISSRRACRWRRPKPPRSATSPPSSIFATA
jgi:hypothetical protein